jgi:hypothetical protein
MTLAKEAAFVLNCWSVKAEIKSLIMAQSDHNCKEFASWFRYEIIKKLDSNFLRILFYLSRAHISKALQQ